MIERRGLREGWLEEVNREREGSHGAVRPDKERFMALLMIFYDLWNSYFYLQ